MYSEYKNSYTEQFFSQLNPPWSSLCKKSLKIYCTISSHKVVECETIESKVIKCISMMLVNGNFHHE